MDKIDVSQQDYKPFPEPHLVVRTRRFSRLHFTIIAGIAAITFLLLATVPFMNAQANKNQVNTAAPSQQVKAQRLTVPLSLPIPAKTTTASINAQSNASSTKNYQFKTVTVKKGDTLTHVFLRAGVDQSEVNQIVRLGKKARNIVHVTPGQVFKIAANSQGKLLQLIYKPSGIEKYIVKRHNDDFAIDHQTRDYERRIQTASGTIKSSLFEAAMDAGLTNNTTMDLAQIFGWDIDFALDIRKNDRFFVTYEDLYLNGEHIGQGNILAAEFVNQGRVYKAVRYTDKNGNSNYYSQNGKSMRKAFLRTPVDFTRISSRFGYRFHPLLKRRKKHEGVDYAAPIGTPIKAAGDGKIVWRGRKGGYGNTIIIQHGRKYSTLYGHMSAFNRRFHSGSMVKQGQIIGYVGSTGRSTGPHLHYEFRVWGRHRNPLTVKLPDAKPIKKAYLADFKAKSHVLLGQLDLMKDTSLAFNEAE